MERTQPTRMNFPQIPSLFGKGGWGHFGVGYWTVFEPIYVKYKKG